jgi:RNA polymerase sigma-70 factor (ECF subfamily)
MATSREQAQWVLRAQCNDREALELLLRSAQPSLHRYLCGVVGRSSADDVLQDVLILVCRKLTWLQAPELFRPWVYRIASRAAFRYLKQERLWSEQVRDEVLLEGTLSPDAHLPEGVIEDLLNAGVLSPASRAVLTLHFQEELSLPEVAAILEIPLGTVKSRLAYGLTALRKQFDSKRSF